MQPNGGDSDDVTRYGFIADEVLPVASQYVEIKEGLIDGVTVDDFKSLIITGFIKVFPIYYLLTRLK